MTSTTRNNTSAASSPAASTQTFSSEMWMIAAMIAVEAAKIESRSRLPSRVSERSTP